MSQACRMVVAIDGPAASGKTTLARALAKRLGLPFLDTGRIYRAVARRLLERRLDPEDEPAIVALARGLRQEDLEGTELDAEEVGAMASRIAALPAVREALLAFQRAFAMRPEGAVLAGRDIGSVICPEAPAKLFVTASVEERARRRVEQLRRRGEHPIYARVLEEMQERDRRDRERAVAPLRAVPDAFVLDTTGLAPEEALERAVWYVEDRLSACGRNSDRTPEK